MALVTINTGQANIAPEAVLRFLGGSQAPITITSGFYLVQLDASPSSDPDGVIVNYKFERRINGMDWAIIDIKSTPTSTNQILNTGTYEYRVTVTDQHGLEDVSNIIVVNFTKTAVVPCDALINGLNFVTRWIQPLFAKFVLDGTDSEAGGIGDIITSYEWEFTSGPSGNNATIDNPVASKTSIGFLDVEGIYYVKLTVKSSNGTEDDLLVEIEAKDTDENGNYL